MNKRDVFMTLPAIVQAYFQKEYFEETKPKGLRKLDVRDTMTRFKAKNEIKYSFEHKYGSAKPDSLFTDWKELFNLIP